MIYVTNASQSDVRVLIFFCVYIHQHVCVGMFLSPRLSASFLRLTSSASWRSCSACWAMSSLATLDVMMKMASLHSMVFPLPSVRRPWERDQFIKETSEEENFKKLFVFVSEYTPHQRAAAWSLEHQGGPCLLHQTGQRHWDTPSAAWSADLLPHVPRIPAGSRWIWPPERRERGWSIKKVNT